MSVMVILEMDGDPDALLAAAAALEESRPTSAVTARVVAQMDVGVVAAVSGLMTAVPAIRSRVFENAELYVIYGCTEISRMGTTFPVPRDESVARHTHIVTLSDHLITGPARHIIP